MDPPLVVDRETWRDWAATSFGHGAPIIIDGRMWLCVGCCYEALDRFGYSPAERLELAEVVPQEEWPEAYDDRYGSRSKRGDLVRVGHALRGRPYVYTGARRHVGVNCGRPTEHSPGGPIYEPMELP